MKRYFNIPMAIIVLATCLIAGAQAQAQTPQRMVADIPFTFAVGKTSLPAGKYAISVVNVSSDRKVLQIQSKKSGKSVMILTNIVSGNVSDNSKLVFERYDDRYFFAQAQMAGETTSLAALRPKIKQTLAMSGKKSLVVVIAG